MLYTTFAPSTELSDIVDGYWYTPIEGNKYSKQQYNTPLYEGLIFNLTHLKKYRECEGKTTCMTKEAYIIGQAKSYAVTSGIQDNDGYLIGVKLKPLGLIKITGIKKTYLANHIIDAEEIWGKEIKWLCERMKEADSTEGRIMILEQFLKKQLKEAEINHRLTQVENAISLMQARKGIITCKELQYLTNTSRKTLERAFSDFHGLKPKIYNQIIRFNAAIQTMNKNNQLNLTIISHRLGYFDQSHFIRDFKRFAGQTPTMFLKTMEEKQKERTIPIDWEPFISKPLTSY